MARSYSLVGPDAVAANELGIAEAAWFTPPIDPDRLADFQRRTNMRPAIDLALWFGLLIAFGATAVALWPSPTALLPLLAYGAVYGGTADARWHEMGHSTAFRSQWLNDAVYRLASFMMWREATVWRWSHHRHHTDTLIVGRDMEIAFQRPTSRATVIKAFSGVAVAAFWKRILLHASGGRDPEVATFMPETEWRAVHREARVYLTIQAAAVAASIATLSPLPVLLVGLPAIYGVWMAVFFGITQHAGLQENVLDHRLNTRTVYMNPVFRFLYLNMNYHTEHHMFPTVPYYNLPRLHDEIKEHLPQPLPSTMAAYRELLGAMKAQRADPAFELDRHIPEVSNASRQRIAIAGNGPVAKREGEAIRVSTVGLAVGRARRVDVNSETYALFRLGDDDYVVTDGYCTHGRAHLADGVVLDCAVIECPKHNGRFDIRTGEALRRPVTVDLTSYRCRPSSDGRSVLFDPFTAADTGNLHPDG